MEEYESGEDEMGDGVGIDALMRASLECVRNYLHEPMRCGEALLIRVSR